MAPLTYIPAAFGIVRLLRHPRKKAFLLAWLAAPAPWMSLGELLSTEAVRRYRARAREQRTQAGRIKAAILVYAYALEKDYPDRARGARSAAGDFGAVANILVKSRVFRLPQIASRSRLKDDLFAFRLCRKTLGPGDRAAAGNVRIDRDVHLNPAAASCQQNVPFLPAYHWQTTCKMRVLYVLKPASIPLLLKIS